MCEGKLYEYMSDSNSFWWIESHLDEAKEEFPEPVVYPYETTVGTVEERYQEWFKKWFGDV